MKLIAHDSFVFLDSYFLYPLFQKSNPGDRGLGIFMVTVICHSWIVNLNDTRCTPVQCSFKDIEDIETQKSE